jgi:hypothetical protein
VIPPSTTITDEGRRVRRFLLALLAVVIALNLARLGWERLFPSPQVSGPAGSSYVTTAYGAAAYAELLEETGHQVSRLRASWRGDRLRVPSTVVLIEPRWDSFAQTEIEALRRYLDAGGRLVIAGRVDPRLMEELTPLPPEWQPSGPEAATASPLLPGIGTVVLGGRGTFAAPGSATVLLAGPEGEAVMVRLQIGQGEVIWLADSTPLLNTGLSKADSAGLAVALAGGRRVVFDEYRHGYGGDGLVDSLPGGWAVTLLLLLAAGMVWMITYGRRLGPPEPRQRPLPPERSVFLDSVAGILGRTRPVSDAVEPVRARARRLLARRAGLGGDASREEMAHAGMALGLDEDEIAALFDEESAPARAGRVLAELERREKP